jgi:hypothetical protein
LLYQCLSPEYNPGSHISVEVCMVNIYFTEETVLEMKI